MVKVREDMTGWVMSEHGVLDSQLIVIRQTDDRISPQGNHYARWLVQCNCGSEPFSVDQSHIRNGHTKTCGHELKKENVYDLSGEYGIGWTTNTNEPFYFDLDDYDVIKSYRWTEHRPFKNYRTLVTNTGGKMIKFWWVIVGKHCDHKNHNTFDNRKDNLRVCSQQLNTVNAGLRSDNTSGIIGISQNKPSGKWFGYLNQNGKRVFTSQLFTNKEDAIRERLLAELKYDGEFAPQRHLFKDYGIESQETEAVLL